MTAANATSYLGAIETYI